MIYEAEVMQIVRGTIFVEADDYEKAEEAATKYVQEEPNVATINFDNIWDYSVWGVSEVSDDKAGEAEIIKAEDVL